MSPLLMHVPGAGCLSLVFTDSEARRTRKSLPTAGEHLLSKRVAEVRSDGVDKFHLTTYFRRNITSES